MSKQINLKIKNRSVDHMMKTVRAKLKVMRNAKNVIYAAKPHVRISLSFGEAHIDQKVSLKYLQTLLMENHRKCMRENEKGKKYRRYNQHFSIAEIGNFLFVQTYNTYRGDK